jgi:hypothetical protein
MANRRPPLPRRRTLVQLVPVGILDANSVDASVIRTPPESSNTCRTAAARSLRRFCRRVGARSRHLRTTTRTPLRPAGHRVRHVMLGPLGSDEPGHAHPSAVPGLGVRRAGVVDAFVVFVWGHRATRTSAPSTVGGCLTTRSATDPVPLGRMTRRCCTGAGASSPPFSRSSPSAPALPQSSSPKSKLDLLSSLSSASS